MRKRTVAIVTLGIAALIWMAVVEPLALNAERMQFNAFGGNTPAVKIVHFTDVHAAYYYPGYVEKLVAKINVETPDLVLITGDVTNGGSDDANAVAVYSAIKSKYGVYAILGNHDYGRWGCPLRPESLETAGKIKESLKAAGVTVLENENRILEINGKKMALAGVGDEWACRNDLEKALEGIAPSTPTIIMAHEPTIIKREFAGKNLVLSGHTHCGQVRIPIVTNVILEHTGFGKVIRGTAAIGSSSLMYVSCGVTPGLLRLNTPTQYAVIDLT